MSDFLIAFGLGVISEPAMLFLVFISMHILARVFRLGYRIINLFKTGLWKN